MSSAIDTLYAAQTAQSHTAHTDPKSVPNPDDFRQVLMRVDPNDPTLPPAIATRINAALLPLAERDPKMAARVEAAELFREEATPLHHKIANNLGKFRALFDKLGIPFADTIRISQGADGRFSIDGHGSLGKEDIPVDHPQGAFIEAVMNGDIPELADISKKIQSLFAEIEEWHDQIEGVKERVGELTGERYTRQNGFFDSNVFIAGDALATYATEGRVLSIKDPNTFDAFKETLGDQIENMDHNQILARFYFEQVERPKLAERFPDYFA